MSQLKATPGPWASFQFGSSGMPDEIGLAVCVAGRSLQGMMGEEENIICLLTNPAADADAAIIAAAPRLYAALEYVERWISTGGHEGNDDTALEMASAALAAARGEQSDRSELLNQVQR